MMLCVSPQARAIQMGRAVDMLGLVRSTPRATLTTDFLAKATYQLSGDQWVHVLRKDAYNGSALVKAQQIRWKKGQIAKPAILREIKAEINSEEGTRGTRVTKTERVGAWLLSAQALFNTSGQVMGYVFTAKGADGYTASLRVNGNLKLLPELTVRGEALAHPRTGGWRITKDATGLTIQPKQLGSVMLGMGDLLGIDRPVHCLFLGCKALSGPLMTVDMCSVLSAGFSLCVVGKSVSLTAKEPKFKNVPGGSLLVFSKPGFNRGV